MHQVSLVTALVIGVIAVSGLARRIRFPAPILLVAAGVVVSYLPGHVGCCDSSRGRHAAAHFRDHDHPVMRSVEPGEAWRWCYVDRLVG